MQEASKLSQTFGCFKKVLALYVALAGLALAHYVAQVDYRQSLSAFLGLALKVFTITLFFFFCSSQNY